ncbi:magnesium transporter CorA family protein [Candidatus Thorarchaeota archaeon]|nr:MAG: magnesium transporter CorA family protein [Candidatus Thorarchaeota archaeon]
MMSTKEKKESSCVIMALESGIEYENLESAPEEPLLVEMIGIQPDMLLDISRRFDIDLEDLQDLNDPDERPRLQVEDKFTLVVLRVPLDLDVTDRVHSTAPVGMVTNGRDIIIIQNERFPLRKKRLLYAVRRATTPSEVIYREWEAIIHSFETTLDIIEMTIKNTEASIMKELYPSRMDRFFQLSRDAIFIETALRSNMRVLRRMRSLQRVGRMILYEDRLEELAVDLKQQMDLSSIYRELIENAMNAYDSIVNHNLNRVMKTLTSISLLVSVPTLIASIYGMNVGLPLEQDPLAFPVIMILSILITLPVLIILRTNNLV